MTDHTLRALGLDAVPVLAPLAYPGRPVPGPGLLCDEELLPLRADGGPVGGWAVGGRGAGLDAVLRDAGVAGTDERLPVLAVGSNACPAQVRHKLVLAGLPVAVPMSPLRVRGIAAGVSAHISLAGYVSASPYGSGVSVATLAVGWLDADQLAAVDATEPHYHRVTVDGDAFPMTLPGGTRLPSAALYVHRHGVLALDGRTPLTARDQPALLRRLLGASDALRALLGPDPDAWVATVAADPAARAAGAEVFRREGWLLRPSGLPTLAGTGPPWIAS
ncbi:hypothetical protein K7472_28105 [Streptomyces sp. PTM05]|uniref:Uncharacterized protein n=1 Tax=Streptantibioticus parmotrematis TaxID=2873249 RepID=A0ABS7R0I4_9ACTN|nr:hypothetical protein [Streptantibioticus parmotrematis]MBY8888678.1 hypothetical protein [Streptantibioticus parmotrematis]